MRILFLGDIGGRSGRDAVGAALPQLRTPPAWVGAARGVWGRGCARPAPTC